eukprot:RCo022551
MSSFADRLKRLGTLTQQNIAERAEAESRPKEKRRRTHHGQSQQTPQKQDDTPEDLVLKALSDFLDWKVRPKKVLSRLKQGLLNDSWLLEVRGEGMFVVRKAVDGASELRRALGISLEKEALLAGLVGR